jgi:hypothetical protein
MEQDEVDSVPLVADAKPALATDKREILPQLKEKRLELQDEGLLQLGL